MPSESVSAIQHTRTCLHSSVGSTLGAKPERAIIQASRDGAKAAHTDRLWRDKQDRKEAQSANAGRAFFICQRETLAPSRPPEDEWAYWHLPSSDSLSHFGREQVVDVSGEPRRE